MPAYTNHGSPARPSLWMPLPHLASPYKGEETEGRPHKSLKSRDIMPRRAIIKGPTAFPERNMTLSPDKILVVRLGASTPSPFSQRSSQP